jgi:group II intron reverse transcriptase/maturase
MIQDPPLHQLQRQLLKDTAAQRPIPNLLPWLADRRNLDSAWDRVRQSAGAQTPGADGVTAAEAERRPESWLPRLAEEIVRGQWKPTPPRWIDIPKPAGKGTRRLGILTIRDRVVHACLKQILEPLFESLFLDGSFGFRPGRSVAAALQQVSTALSSNGTDKAPYTFAIGADVNDCFGTLDHNVLLHRLERHIADSHVLSLLRTLFEPCGTPVRSWWTSRTCGVIQGSSLSPLLCNLYLHDLDLDLQKLSDDTHGGVRWFRYADDLLLIARSASLIESAYKLTRRTLAAGHQKLSRHKLRRGLVTAGIDWLGMTIRPVPEPWRAGMRFTPHIPPDKVRRMLERLAEMTTPPSSYIDPSAFDLGRWIVSLNEQLRDWRSTCLFADNAPLVFRSLDEFTYEHVAELVHAVTGKNRRQIISEFHVFLPRGFRTWQINGVRLVVLSSLAPQAPSHLIRRAPWHRKPNNRRS